MVLTCFARDVAQPNRAARMVVTRSIPAAAAGGQESDDTATATVVQHGQKEAQHGRKWTPEATNCHARCQEVRADAC